MLNFCSTYRTTVYLKITVNLVITDVIFMEVRNVKHLRFILLTILKVKTIEMAKVIITVILIILVLGNVLIFHCKNNGIINKYKI